MRTGETIARCFCAGCGVDSSDSNSRMLIWRGSRDGRAVLRSRNSWSRLRSRQVRRSVTVSVVRSAAFGRTANGCTDTVKLAVTNLRMLHSLCSVSGFTGAKFIRNKSSVPRIIHVVYTSLRARTPNPLSGDGIAPRASVASLHTVSIQTDQHCPPLAALALLQKLRYLWKHVLAPSL